MKVLDQNGLAVFWGRIKAALSLKLDAAALSPWAKAGTKPKYTAEEVGALPLSGGQCTGTLGAAKLYAPSLGCVKLWQGSISPGQTLTAPGAARYASLILACRFTGDPTDAYVTLPGGIGVRGQITTDGAYLTFTLQVRANGDVGITLDSTTGGVLTDLWAIVRVKS
ncbi:MAG: hypothetical protein RSC76_03875 [Oscillospiraceae bacterium]